MKRNPYLNRSMIRSVDQFYGRQRELERLMARIGAPTPQSVSIVGERRVGKSSLLWHLAQEEIYRRYLDTPNQYLFLLLDLQGQQHLDEQGFCRIFGQHLINAAGSRLKLPMGSDFSGVERMVQTLEQAGLRLICLFDEFESIPRNPVFGAEFFGFLRSLANVHPVAFITSSRRDLQSLCHTCQIAESPFFNIFSQVRLGPFVESEALELIRVPSSEAGRPLETHTAELLRLGGRLPLFLQLACSTVFEHLAEQESQTLDLDLVEHRFAQEADSHFRYLWEHFTAEEREVCACLANGVRPSQDQIGPLKVLEQDGYAERGALFSSAFARFVREQMAGAPLIPQPILLTPLPRQESIQLEPLPEGVHPFPELIGQSLALRRLLALMQKALVSDCTVLLAGETGTGKELVARILHQHSLRRDHPLVAVNCGAIAEHLQESELFGHKKGAFTGALADREGLFESAHGGTLFLDEISETSPSTQVKLLRVLQEGEIRRVGENTPRKVEVRLICSTNRHLQEEVAQGRFREDLYYRLHVLVILLPPLRERRADIPLLIDHLLRDYPEGISPAAIQILELAPWPGNIRELENQLASARVLAGGGCIEPGHLWARLQQAPPTSPGESLPGDILGLKEARERFECSLIQARLTACNWDLDEAARTLEISRSGLYEMIRRYGLKEG